MIAERSAFVYTDLGELGGQWSLVFVRLLPGDYPPRPLALFAPDSRSRWNPFRFPLISIFQTGNFLGAIRTDNIALLCNLYSGYFQQIEKCYVATFLLTYGISDIITIFVLCAFVNCTVIELLMVIQQRAEHRVICQPID
jgi:hypothetical protein